MGKSNRNTKKYTPRNNKTLVNREKHLSNVLIYEKKRSLLEEKILTEEVEQVLGEAPAGKVAGYAVFLSVCDTKKRARVFCGVGKELCSAWKNADENALKFIKVKNYNPVWVKADVVYSSEIVSKEELKKRILKSRHEFYRDGVAFDSMYQVALLEAELNGAKIWDYEEGEINLQYLNEYLIKSGRFPLSKLPEMYKIFRCRGWICDDNKKVYSLSTDKLNYGRREIVIDDNYAKDIILNASTFLENQLKEDGSFIYGMYPRFDHEIKNYNILRHSGTIWALCFGYRVEPSQRLKETIDLAIKYMLDNMIYDAEGRGYIYEKKSEEIKLGGLGIAILVLTEYMDIFDSEEYKEICCALGKGILSMFDRDTGEYYHVLNRDFTRKERFRTIFYEGEVTFAILRLYKLTGDSTWLDAARCAVEHFIKEDYTRFKDHWIAYAMNELVQYDTDNELYYKFALDNAKNNLVKIYNGETTAHIYLELLMESFELYNRMVEKGITVEGYDVHELLKVIRVRINRQLNGYFYPEYAMYMRNPQKILNTFMIRHDGYRVRIDDVQHNIDGIYLYWKNYKKMVEYGLLEE